MNTQGIFGHESIKPFSQFGFTSDLLVIHHQTIIATWITIGVLVMIALFARSCINRKNSYTRYLTLAFVKSFKDMFCQSVSVFNYTHFSYITSLFLFIIMCNIISLIPWIEEPTADLNTPLALGIIVFMYNQISSIRTNGIIRYVKEYFEPFPLMFPLHVTGNLSNIISISFRLFGNIFGGSIIVKLYTQLISGAFLYEVLGILSGINILVTVFFSLFEGLIQAFVFAMLALTYLSIAVAPHQGNES